jgi:hypothetical protein
MLNGKIVLPFLIVFYKGVLLNDFHSLLLEEQAVLSQSYACCEMYQDRRAATTTASVGDRRENHDYYEQVLKGFSVSHKDATTSSKEPRTVWMINHSSTFLLVRAGKPVAWYCVLAHLMLP